MVLSRTLSCHMTSDDIAQTPWHNIVAAAAVDGSTMVGQVAHGGRCHAVSFAVELHHHVPVNAAFVGISTKSA